MPQQQIHVGLAWLLGTKKGDARVLYIISLGFFVCFSCRLTLTFCIMFCSTMLDRLSTHPYFLEDDRVNHLPLHCTSTALAPSLLTSRQQVPAPLSMISLEKLMGAWSSCCLPPSPFLFRRGRNLKI